MGFWQRLLGPRDDEPEPVEEKPPPPPLVLDDDLKVVNAWADNGFLVHFHMWPEDRYNGKTVSITVKKDNIEVSSGRYDSLGKCVEEMAENFPSLGLTLEGKPDSIGSVAPEGSDLGST